MLLLSYLHRRKPMRASWSLLFADDRCGVGAAFVDRDRLRMATPIDCSPEKAACHGFITMRGGRPNGYGTAFLHQSITIGLRRGGG
jgi:hypothetical protein